MLFEEIQYRPQEGMDSNFEISTKKFLGGNKCQ